MSQILRWSVILITQGYSPSFHHDIQSINTSSYHHLIEIPISLLPIAKIPLLDHWIALIKSIDSSVAIIDDIFVISSRDCHQLYVNWALTHHISCENIVSSNIDSISLKIHNLGSNGVILINTGVLLCNDFKINSFLEKLNDNSSGVLYHCESTEVDQDFSLNHDNSHEIIDMIIRKQEGVNKEYLQIMALRQTHYQRLFPLLTEFSQCLSLDNLFLSLFKPLDLDFRVYPSSGVYQFNTLAQYIATDAIFSDILRSRHIMTQTVRTSDRCYARIGLMGNPSDGYHGKTLSMLIGNFYAEVYIESYSSSSSESESGLSSTRVRLIPHRVHDRLDFDNFDHLHLNSVVTVSDNESIYLSLLYIATTDYISTRVITVASG